ncbi:phosphate transport system permease protein [Longispora fulva]|uniref:Phosphate transport system permease protein n=1 Tax=Longispora fulva TaxID=619741 RepID=A0A8J7GU88_9ACTN|nr:phosphate ABC transporter permease subunit PstC [Longispora fulva]MBG6137431.1 phosphate transport system permease protein [Longispora fulva]GIG61214.1 phosphate transport system permease protein [Longispora fulva]
MTTAETKDEPRGIAERPAPSDRVFGGALRLAGMVVLVTMGLVGTFLTIRAVAALRIAGWSFFTTESWEPDSGTFGIAAVLTGTVLIASVAIVVAIPLAVGTALYISEYAPRRLKPTLVSLVDLMAAVPSIAYGLWGFHMLQPMVLGLARWMATYLSWFPLFAIPSADSSDPLETETVYKSSAFIAGLVVAMMITPIMCSIMREVFTQAPAGEREGAYALGGTRWGMIRTVVLPYGRGGIIGGTMLGLGRALGETIAVYVIISPVFVIQPHILQSGANSVSALIALRNGEAGALGTSALMAAGLTLFVMTLIINFLASMVITRSRSGADSDA